MGAINEVALHRNSRLNVIRTHGVFYLSIHHHFNKKLEMRLICIHFFRESPKQYPVLIPTLYCQVGAFAYFCVGGLLANCRG